MSQSLTPEEANVILQFLNRVPVTGHQERNSMNIIVDKLIPVAQPTAAAPAPAPRDPVLEA